MFTRTIALAAALSTAGALSAYAQSTVGDDVTNKGTELENAADVSSDGDTVVDVDTREVKGQDFVVVGAEKRADAGEGVVDEVEQSEVDPGSDSTETENVLAAAEPGQIVRTVQGDPVGTVASKERYGDGYLVYVTADPAAGLQVPTVGIQVKSLQTVEEGTALEYAFSIEYLRERIAEALERG